MDNGSGLKSIPKNGGQFDNSNYSNKVIYNGSVLDSDFRNDRQVEGHQRGSDSMTM